MKITIVAFINAISILSFFPVFASDYEILWEESSHIKAYQMIGYWENDERVFTHDKSGYFRVWSLQDHKLIKEFISVVTNEIHFFDNSDSLYLFSDKVYLFNKSNDSIIRSLDLPKESVSFSHNSDTIVSLYQYSQGWGKFGDEYLEVHNYISVYDLRNDVQIKIDERIIKGTGEFVKSHHFNRCVALSPHGNNLAIYNDSGYINIYNIHSKKTIQNIYVADKFVTKLFYLPDGKNLLYSTSYGKLYKLDLNSLQITRVNINNNTTFLTIFSFYNKNNFFCIVNPLNNTVRSDALYLFDGSKGIIVDSVVIHNLENIQSYKISEDFNKAIAISTRGSVYEFNPRTSDSLSPITSFDYPVTNAQFNGSKLYTFSNKKMVQRDCNNGYVNYVAYLEDQYKYLDLSDDGNSLLYAQSDNSLTIYDTESHSVKSVISGPSECISAVAISNDKNYYAVAGKGNILIWDAVTKNFIKLIKLGSTNLKTEFITFHPNSKDLLVYSNPTFDILDIESGKVIKTLPRVLDAKKCIFINDSLIMVDAWKNYLVRINIRKATIVDTIVKFDFKIIGFALSTDQSKIGIINELGQIFIFDQKNQTLVMSCDYVGEFYTRSSCFFTKDDKSLIFTLHYSLLDLNIETNQLVELKRDNGGGDFKYTAIADSSNSFVYCNCGDVYIFDEISKKIVNIKKVWANPCSGTCAISADGKLILVSPYICDGVVDPSHRFYIWDSLSGYENNILNHGKYYKAAKYTNKDEIIYYFGDFPYIYNMDSSCKTITRVLYGSYELLDIFTNDTKKIIAWTSYISSIKDYQLSLAPMSTMIRTNMLRGKYFGISSFSNDGQYMVTEIEDNKFAIIKVDSFQIIRVIDGHKAKLKYLTFDNTNERIISVAEDNTIRFWQVSTGNNYDSISYSTNFINAVSNEDCSKLFCSASDGNLIMYDINKIITSVPNGIVDSDSISIYPNPATDYISISPNYQFQCSTIYNTYGQKLMETDNTNLIYIGHLSPGMYLIKSGTSISKFIKY